MVPAIPAVVVTPGDTTAIVQWTIDPNATGYEVEYFSDALIDPLHDAPALYTALTFGAGVYSCLLTDLLDGVQYTLTVTASNADGSTSSVATTLMSAISPTGVTQTDPGSGLDPTTEQPAPEPILLPTTPLNPLWLMPELLYAPEVHVSPSMPGVRQAAVDLSVAPPVPPRIAGHVQVLYFTDLNTGEILYVTPSRGGIYIQDLDLGYPTVREVSSDAPDQHGSIDQTRYYGNRAVTLSVLCRDGVDANGVVQSAAAWADLMRSWSALARSIKMTYQLWGQHPREMFLRTSQLGSPITGSGIGRETIPVTMGFKSPDGLLWSVPLPGYDTDPARPGYYRLTTGVAGGNGLTFPATFPMNFGGGAGPYANSVSVPGDTVGSAGTSPIITIRGGATQPKLSIAGRNGVRAKLEFTVSAGGNLVIAPTDVLVIDVANRRAVINPDANGDGTNVFKYLAPPAAWRDFLIQPQDTNLLTFYPVSANSGTVVEIAYRQASV